MTETQFRENVISRQELMDALSNRSFIAAVEIYLDDYRGVDASLEAKPEASVRTLSRRAGAEDLLKRLRVMTEPNPPRQEEPRPDHGVPDELRKAEEAKNQFLK